MCCFLFLLSFFALLRMSVLRPSTSVTAWGRQLKITLIPGKENSYTRVNFLLPVVWAAAEDPAVSSCRHCVSLRNSSKWTATSCTNQIWPEMRHQTSAILIQTDFLKAQIQTQPSLGTQLVLVEISHLQNGSRTGDIVKKLQWHRTKFKVRNRRP